MELVLSVCGIAVILLYMLYTIVRGVWICVWDSYISGPLEDHRREKEAERLRNRTTVQFTGPYYQSSPV